MSVPSARALLRELDRLPAPGRTDHGWPPPWRAVLATLRAHPDRRARGDARDVVIDRE